MVTYKLKIFSSAIMELLEKEVSEYLNNHPKEKVFKMSASEVALGEDAYSSIYLLLICEELEASSTGRDE